MLSVLVVDRESDILGLFETILKRMGHRVKTQESLDDNEADGEEYDLIILDIESYELEYSSLLGAYTYNKLCVSSILKEARLPPGFVVDYDYYLQKPFRIDSLRKIIGSVTTL